MRKIILGSIVGALCILLVTGFYYDQHIQLENQGKKLVDILGNTNVQYDKAITSSDEIVGAVYEGDFQYSDSAYQYFVDPVEKYVTAIMKKSQDKALTLAKQQFVLSEEEVIDLFENNLNDYLVGDVVCSVINSESSTMKVYTVSEVVNGIETGTTAMVVLDQNDVLLSATFIKGNSDSVAELNRQSFLTLDEATDIALQGIYRRNPDIQNIVIEVGQDKKTGSIKTFKGDTFWMIPLYVTETFADGKQRSNFYEVRVDVLTGEVLDIAYSLD